MYVYHYRAKFVGNRVKHLGLMILALFGVFSDISDSFGYL
jgi:hypothetical protein